MGDERMRNDPEGFPDRRSVVSDQCDLQGALGSYSAITAESISSGKIRQTATSTRLVSELILTMSNGDLCSLCSHFVKRWGKDILQEKKYAKIFCCQLEIKRSPSQMDKVILSLLRCH